MKISNICSAYNCLLIAAAVLITFTSCKKDEATPAPEPEKRQVTYTLNTKDMLGVSGKVTFIDQSANETVITIALNGVASGTHPAHIHANSAVETGTIVIPLTDVDASGKSTTTVLRSYDELINFDGYLNVHESALKLGTVIAQGDIGGNLLTGEAKTYNLSTAGGLGVSGTFKVEKRKNGFTLATVKLTGTVNDGMYPAHIHTGSVTTLTPETVVIELNKIAGATGVDAISMTTIRKRKDNSSITYADLIVYTGYLDVHKSETDNTVIALGNIGSNQQ